MRAATRAAAAAVGGHLVVRRSASLDHVLANVDSLVIRPISRGHGRSVIGSALTAEQREQLSAKIKALPHRYVGQEVLQLSSVPTSQDDRLVRRQVCCAPSRCAATARTSRCSAAWLGSPTSPTTRVRWSPLQMAGCQGRLDRRPGAGHGCSDCGAAPPHRGGRAISYPLSPVGRDGAAGAQRHVLVRPLRRAGRRPAPLILATRTVAIETDRDTTQGTLSRSAAGGDPRQHHLSRFPGTTWP